MKTSADILAEHQKQHPTCVAAFTCPHTQNFVGMVIFKEPDNGFLATIQAFDLETALVVFTEGVKKTRPDLHIKKIEVDFA